MYNTHTVLGFCIIRRAMALPCTQRRARNREAAKRCRAKRRGVMQQLEGSVAGLTDKCKGLVAELTQMQVGCW